MLQLGYHQLQEIILAERLCAPGRARLAVGINWNW
jgi:hypothetical protein